MPGQRLALRPAGEPDAPVAWLDYDELVVGTGAVPVVPPIDGLDTLGPAEGVHLLHSMGDTFALTDTLERIQPKTALIVGAGYVGLEMAEGFTARGTTGLHVASDGPDGQPLGWDVDLVLVLVGVRPDTDLLTAAGAATGQRGAVVVDETMATGLPHVWAAGDCTITHHRLLGATYLPLGTTAHKQGRIAGENALGGHARFAGSLGTQVVKVFDLVAARTGLRDHEAAAAGFAPVSTTSTPDDHKAYYPGAHPITIRITGDATTGRLLGAQLIGPRGTETPKRVDTYATALFHGMTVAELSDLDLSYTPPFGSPWDAVQMAAQAWVREHQLQAEREAITGERAGV